MAHWRSMIESQWLRHHDIEGHEPVVTIVRVVGGEVVGQGGKKSKKPVLYFQGKEKPLAIGATIGKTIERMYGPDTADWVGKKIKLYVTTTESGGETVGCIRVRQGVPEEPRQQQRTNGNGNTRRPPAAQPAAAGQQQLEPPPDPPAPSAEPEDRGDEPTDEEWANR
jgi:hypothetical protein